MAALHYPAIVIATRNKGKLKEFRSLLAGCVAEILGLTDVGLEDDCDENGATFEENARLKAIFYSTSTCFPVLADDSGLEVSALGGRPGIFSARYAGPVASDSDRICKLIDELRAVGTDRSARFVCALSLAVYGKILKESRGECCGVIAETPRGMHGFGYDPVFFIPEMNKTYAELSDDDKNSCSHRARAVRALMEM